MSAENIKELQERIKFLEKENERQSHSLIEMLTAGKGINEKRFFSVPEMLTAWQILKSKKRENELERALTELLSQFQDTVGILKRLREAENEDANNAGRNIPWAPEIIVPERYKKAKQIAERLLNKKLPDEKPE